MTLFQPDTKAKNLFLSKLSILVDKPILFDLYRFGTNFEFKYGQVLIILYVTVFQFSFIKFDKTLKGSTQALRIGSQTSQKNSAVFKWQVENQVTFQKRRIGKLSRRYEPVGKQWIVILRHFFYVLINYFQIHFLILNKRRAHLYFRG